MIDVKFTREDGCCPYFLYENVKFYIQDTRDYKDEFVYQLYSKNLNSEYVSFCSTEEVDAYLKTVKGLKFVIRTDRAALYQTASYYYRVMGKILCKYETPTPLGGSYESYIDCLEFSKKYVLDYIKADSFEQKALF